MSKYYDIYEEIYRQIQVYQKVRKRIIALKNESGNNTVRGELEEALSQIKALEKRMGETDFGWTGPDANSCRSKLYELDAQAGGMITLYNTALQNMLEGVEQKIIELQPQLSDAMNHFDDLDYARAGINLTKG